MTAISGFSTNLAEAFSQRTPNERRLLVGLALVALAAAPIKASGMREEASARHDEVQAELDRARQMAGRSQGGVAGQLAGERTQVRSWSWQAENTEVGRVLVQNRIAQMAEEAHLTEIEVKLNDKAQAAGEIELVPLDLTANFSWTGLSAFVAAMESSGKGFIIDSVQRPDSDKPRLRVSLRVPVAAVPNSPPGGST